MPFLLHLLDPTLFTQDWFVQSQAGSFGIRTFFVYLIYAPATFLPVWLTVLLMYVSSWLAIAGAVYHIGHSITRDRVAAAGAVVAVLVLTPQWTLGGNDLVHSMLVPSMIAWALALWGMVFFLRGSFVVSGPLLGLSTWMQALVGLQAAGLLGLVQLVRMLKDRDVRFPLRTFLLFSGSFLLFALPALVPLAYQQLAESAVSPGGDTPSLFYIMARFRNPHHYLFLSFSERSLVRFGALAVLGPVGFLYLNRRRIVQHATILAALLAVIAVLGVAAFLLTEVVPVLFVAKLQLFKTTVLAKLVLVVLVCGAVSAVLPRSLHGLVDKFLSMGGKGLAATVLAWGVVIGLVVFPNGPLEARAHPLAHRESPVAAVEQWARTQTPVEAVFAVPPSWSGFRSRAQRGVVVTFKAFPYRDALIFSWFERLTDLAPIPLPSRATPDIQAHLDAAFEHQSTADLQHLAEHYRFDYVVRSTPIDPPSPFFEPIFSAVAWTVYQVRPSNLVSE